MRYFFNLVSAESSLRDEEGIEVGLDEIYPEAVKAIEEMRQADPSVARDWKGWRLEVTDSSGAVLFAINLDAFTARHALALSFASFLLLKSGEFAEDLAKVAAHASVL